MTISETSGTNGIAIASEIQEFIHQLSAELAKDERDVQRDARAEELAQGLEAAEHMHEKADDIRAGAIVSGSLTVVAGVIDGVAMTKAEKPKTMEGWIETGRTTQSVGGTIGQLFNAAGADAEARANSAEARGKAAGHQADEAVDNERSAHKVDDSGKDLLQEITRSQNAGVMAILARR